MRAPDLALSGVGVAGFEPTASSSRTAGKAVVGVVSAHRGSLAGTVGRCWSASLLYFTAVQLRACAGPDG